MAYEKQTWVDGVTPLDAAHLNHMEQGISQLSTGEPGADGKSAYAYAVEGGYTGTEAEFAAKLAQEKFANPYTLTFAGAVTGSYDGSEAVTVEIPSGGGGIVTATKLYEITLQEEVTSVSETLPFDPMDYKRIILLCNVVTSTNNSSKVSVEINLGGLDMWIPGWLNYTAAQNFHARCQFEIAKGLNLLTAYYTNNYGTLGDTTTVYNAPRYNHTQNDLTSLFSITTQNKYLGVGTSFTLWGIK